MKAVLLLVAMLALCAAGLPDGLAKGLPAEARRPYLPDDCPKECHINNIQPVCAAEFVSKYYARLKTFATSCEIRKYNCANGTRYVFLFNGGCPREG
ncbi:uncharacterized protein LOC117640083 [Thrips palmi]|uniref:Uncharacterized protein LOC117640083 n=1 Tax=Thrips palmi TaxID=161013 RepID=A0A6P8YEF4_THRPL|nr:uncharacterized protein LOC117640083 [Thrips palmi]